MASENVDLSWIPVEHATHYVVDVFTVDDKGVLTITATEVTDGISTATFRLKRLGHYSARVTAFDKSSNPPRASPPSPNRDFYRVLDTGPLTE